MFTKYFHLLKLYVSINYGLTKSICLGIFCKKIVPCLKRHSGPSLFNWILQSRSEHYIPQNTWGNLCSLANNRINGASIFGLNNWKYGKKSKKNRYKKGRVFQLQLVKEHTKSRILKKLIFIVKIMDISKYTL